MLTSFLTQSRMMAAPLALAVQHVQTWLDHALVPAEGMPPDGMPADAKKGGFPKWAIILIGGVAVVCLFAVCILAVLALLGPAIGNTFSSINEGI